MGLIFEKMCRDYLLYYSDSLPVELSEIGQWWGTDPKKKMQIQIDIVGTPVEGRDYIIGSCKYRNEKIGVDELDLIQGLRSWFLEKAIFTITISSQKADSQMDFFKHKSVVKFS